MMMNRIAFILLILLTGAANHVSGQVRWAIEYNLGLPVNIPAPLSIRQNNRQAVNLVAVWSARSFDLPLNWMWRIEGWNNGRAWSFETVHHKMVLNNPTDYIQWFSITHGFNTLTFNRGWEYKKLIVRTGAGIVLAHPESRIDGQDFKEKSGFLKMGYYLTGPVFMSSIARPLRISKGFLVNLEGKISTGYARVPVANGNARLFHLALHLNVGLGFSVRSRSSEAKTKKEVKPRNEI